MCGAHFWSWEHFLSCPLVPARVSVPEFVAMTCLSSWLEIARHTTRVVLLWLSYFSDEELRLRQETVRSFFVK
jgi:hypothetical protein